ncbi:hypothetical protein CapIbe_003426 [Capra ibex]
MHGERRQLHRLLPSHHPTEQAFNEGQLKQHQVLKMDPHGYTLSLSAALDHHRYWKSGPEQVWSVCDLNNLNKQLA